MEPSFLNKLLWTAYPLSHVSKKQAQQNLQNLFGGTNPWDAIMHLTRELVSYRGEHTRRTSLTGARHATLRDAFDKYIHDECVDGWAVEAIMDDLREMADPPTPADLGRVMRHLLFSPPRSRYPATHWEIVAALHRPRDRLSEGQREAILDHVEALSATPEHLSATLQ